MSSIASSLCDTTSPLYILQGLHAQTLQYVMSYHGLPLDLSFEVSRLCLCHHLLYGLCGVSDAHLCKLFSNSLPVSTLHNSVISEVIHYYQNPTSFLPNLRIIIQSLGFQCSQSDTRAMLLSRLDGISRHPPVSANHDPSSFYVAFNRLAFSELLYRAALHGLPYLQPVSALQEKLSNHLLDGNCLNHSDALDGCSSICNGVGNPVFPGDEDAFRASIYVSVSHSIPRSILVAFFLSHEITFETSESLTSLRSKLRCYAKRLTAVAERSFLRRIRDEWPTLVSDNDKKNMLECFQQETSSYSLFHSTCASCAESHLATDLLSVQAGSIDLTILRQPNHMLYPAPRLPGEFSSLMLDPNGLAVNSQGSHPPLLFLCRPCYSAIDHRKLPRFALANKMYLGEHLKRKLLALANEVHLGEVPEVLSDLSPIEESMIAICRAKSWIVQLRSQKDSGSLDNISTSPINQRALRGHVITFPQHPELIVNTLPPSIDTIATTICVIFIGSTPPSREWLSKNAKPLCVRADRIRRALVWLKAHNRLYANIAIDENVLNELQRDPCVPFRIEHIAPSEVQETLQSNYTTASEPCTFDASRSPDSSADIPFNQVVICDVNGHASANELRAAAISHVKEKGGAYLQIPHDPSPVNEFNNPTLFPMMYPTLYPYGVGGFGDPDRENPVSFQLHVTHLVRLADKRFQEHHSFLFNAFNIIQRRAVLLHTSLKVKRSGFDNLASKLQSISSATVQHVSERISRGLQPLNDSEENKKMAALLREVNVISSHVPGSSSSKVNMRNEIRGLITSMGLPTFFITINPADVRHPLVKFLAGDDIDLDNLSATDVPGFWEQSLLVAKNPFVAAKFFNIFILSFIRALLRYDKSSAVQQCGILGLVKGYYGTVETQGRGTLHCHMLVWIEGALDPNTLRKKLLDPAQGNFRQRLLDFLDDTISTSIPPHPDSPTTDAITQPQFHPCSTRLAPDVLHGSRDWKIDLHHVVSCSQVHRHTHTCYKHWRGPPQPKECRFNLGPSRYAAMSTIDPETGDVNLRCLDGLVNNFNETILHAIRCNMDLKFIGSGPSAKAIAYYITDYITKMELKANVSVAILELAISRLDATPSTDETVSGRAKRLLQKCANSMISHQEVAAPLVATFLLGYEDHFTSHEYRRLFWTTFESYVEAQMPRQEPLPPDDADISVSNDPYSEHEVLIDVDETGQLFKKSTQVMDYTCRGEQFINICLWDFISQVDRVKRVDRKNGLDTSAETQQLTFEDEPDCDSNDRLTAELISPHDNEKSHYLRLRPKSMRLVVTPIGPAIPRRDKDNQYERYCRLMLILFQPWRNGSDLRKQFQSWEDAFTDFDKKLSPDHRFRSIMNNMQMLHECKDSRDNHIAHRALTDIADQYETTDTRDTFDDSPSDVFNQQDILQHIDAIMSSRSIVNETVDSNTMECVRRAEMCGLFESATTRLDEHMAINTHLQLTEKRDTVLEKEWNKAYATRRETHRQSHVLPSPENDGAASASNTCPTIAIMTDPDEVNNTIIPVLVKGTNVQQNVTASSHDLAEDIMQDWHLNNEQTLAFRIAVKASLTPAKEGSLRMFIGGAAGTGKSRVLNAIRDYFRLTNQERRLRVTAYMGMAARNVSGMTLHAALSVGNRFSRDKLRSMWDGVDFLFVDEVSMIGCHLLYKISQQLSIAKGNTAPFGGINIIFAGDFAQLPPVSDTRLFSHANRTCSASDTYGQESILGALLWLAVDTVVILEEIVRQSGADNIPFVELLTRMRMGKAVNRDCNLLRTRLLTGDEYLSDPGWRDASIIVTGNACKDRMNERLAKRWARDLGQDFHWYYAQDRIGKSDVTDPELINSLQGLPSGKVNGHLGRLPMFIGMRGIVTQNLDVEGGVVNGSLGVITRIRYYTDGNNDRYLKSCVIRISDSDSQPMPHLPAKEYPIMADDTKMTLFNQFSKEKISINRSQMPVVPGYVMTAHRSQGRTLQKVIIDLESCQGAEAAYVMISRVETLHGLMVLRDFKDSKITCALSQDARVENQRLELLKLHTLSIHGTEEQVNKAINVLQMVDTSHLPDWDNIQKSLKNKDAKVHQKELKKAQSQIRTVVEKMPMAVSRAPRIERQAVGSSRVETNGLGEAGAVEQTIIETNLPAGGRGDLGGSISREHLKRKYNEMEEDPRFERFHGREQ